MDNLMEHEHVYRIVDRRTGEHQKVYSRAYHDVYDFDSPESARHANCWGIHADPKQFKIAKYRVTFELIEDECDEEKENNDCFKRLQRRVLV